MILTRDAGGGINVVENVCAHRGMRSGNRKDFVCPYHQWSYTLKGDLQGVPFRRGVKQDGKVNGGMPADFKTEENGLNKLKVATRGGVVFASFDHDIESLEDFMGPAILPWFDRLFDGRKLKILGYNRQRIPGNWKLMQENIKDPYHPGLLHTWFVTFGLWRADNKSQLVMDAHHRHAAMISTRGAQGKADQVTQVSSFKESMQLKDPRFLDIVPEAWWGGPLGDGGRMNGLDAQAYLELVQIYAAYAHAVDSGDWDHWPAFFTENCSYRLQPRENHERGLPLATLSFESRGMLEDRVYGIRETLFHDPYYQRHVVGLPLVHRVDEAGIHSEANYAVFRTKLDGPSTVFNVGRYLDTVVRTPDGLKFAARLAVYDSEMIPNSIIYPI